jgi:hypothetical protein
MTRLPLAAPAADAMRQFIDAVLSLSEDPGPVNVERYLAASRALEESRPAPVARRRADGSNLERKRAA